LKEDDDDDDDDIWHYYKDKSQMKATLDSMTGSMLLVACKQEEIETVQSWKNFQ